MERAILRVLIVDDFEPWRRFVRSILQKLPQLRMIGEESDGLSAVQSAEQLKPDLIVLDVGLPKVNGIAAARKIRELSPNSKILFVSAYRSWEFVEAALATGAGADIVTTDAGKELLTAVDAILRGKQFVSAGLAGDNPLTRRMSTQASLRLVSGRLIEAQEQERARIGRDLHDDIALRLAFTSEDGSARIAS